MLSDYVVRPAAIQDLDDIEALAHEARMGMTSLPRDRRALQKKIVASIKAFREPAQTESGELYLFVAEHIVSHKVVGTCKLRSKMGTVEPCLSFQIDTISRRSQAVKRTVETTLLTPQIGNSGSTEVGGLYVSESHREKGLGRLVSLSRFIFMAMHPERFSTVAMAEMRGLITPEGTSPFWDAVGAHLTQMEFDEADYLSAIDKRFMIDLLPSFPICVDLLPMAAQQVIGRTHPDTEPALRMLNQEGFESSKLIDVFDAGPKVISEASNIRTIQEARAASVGAVISEMDRILYESVRPDDPMFLMANGALEDFRCGVGYLVSNGDSIQLSKTYSTLLNLKAGDDMWFSPLFPHSFLRRFEKWYSKVPISLEDDGRPVRRSRLNR